MQTPTGHEKVIDIKSFWAAVGHRATGSTVVTARADGVPAGLLGLSATHLCADPPLMLVCIDKRTSALATIVAARHFAINYLPHDARDIADTFGGKGPRKGAERFELGQWGILTTGAPVLMNAIGAIDCRLEETIERHNVCLTIGRVVDVLHGPGSDPLVHFRGGYRP
jgi:flavin reductase (DIM6/NTAB) family NADH-FMN oxidoreductase RutF